MLFDRAAFATARSVLPLFDLQAPVELRLCPQASGAAYSVFLFLSSHDFVFSASLAPHAACVTRSLRLAELASLDTLWAYSTQPSWSSRGWMQLRYSASWPLKRSPFLLSSPLDVLRLRSLFKVRCASASSLDRLAAGRARRPAAGSL